MKNQLRKRTQGFTIIEVMIVLAIAGLILAVVLLAVPALQRSQRNNARSTDATHWSGIAADYISNHAGQMPANGAIAIPSGDNFSQLATATYRKWTAADSNTTKVGATTTAAVVETAAACDAGTGNVTSQAGGFAVIWETEPTGATVASFSCINS